MRLETLSISSRMKKEGGCFAKTVFETKTTRRNNNANNSLIGRRRKEIFRGT